MSFAAFSLLGDEDLPYADLNSLYNHLLSNVRNIERVNQVLGFLIIIQAQLHSVTIRRADEMDRHFFWKTGETKACLSRLASLIECKASSYISILHASLSDFLLDPSRSRQFYLCRESVLADHTALGLRHMYQQGLSPGGESSLYSRKLEC